LLSLDLWSFSSQSFPFVITNVVLPVLSVLLLITPQFLGTVFGPWVGLVIGGFGPFLGVLIGYGLIYRGSIAGGFYLSERIWPHLLGVALAGFVSGFAIVKTQGRYNIARTLGFSSLGTGAGTAFAI